jgi:hypothetical protein
MVIQESATMAWLRRAADDPLARRADRLPETLDFREYGHLFMATFHGALPGVEAGFPITLGAVGLRFPKELTVQARYLPFIDGERFIGTFHVHPEDRPPFFDPQDLGSFLRSDDPGFVSLLLARDRLHVLIRSNPFLYISAHHVDRNPALLLEQHTGMLHRPPDAAGLDSELAYRRASLYFLERYDLALYEGDPASLIARTITPARRW